MKLLKRAVLTILLAIAIWETVEFIERVSSVNTEYAPASAQISSLFEKPSLSPKELKVWYDSYNDKYFGNKLPKNTILGYDQHDPRYMATTNYLPTEQAFNIQLNPKYAMAERVESYLLLHESCYIETWTESYPKGGDFDKRFEHGPRWRACMLRIDASGGFREILIDEYQEKMQ